MRIARANSRRHFARALFIVASTIMTACSERRTDADASDRFVDAADHDDAATDIVVEPFHAIVPEETADHAALARLAAWDRLPVFAAGHLERYASQDRGTPEPPPFPILANGNRDLNHFICRSPDARAQAPGVPFVFDLADCPETYVRGFVLTRAAGSGELIRLWLTAFSQARGQPLTTELLRVYIDDVATPILEAPLASILDGSAGEIFAPPFGAGTVAYLAWHYPLVFARKIVIAIDRLTLANAYFYQADLLLDDAPAERHASPTRLAARDTARAVLDATTNGPISPVESWVPERVISLGPGETSTLVDRAGPGTFHALRFRVPTPDLAALRDVALTARWDTETAPAIDLSLADLFATALDTPNGATLATSVTASGTDTTLAFRLPMPFATRAVLTVENRGAMGITFAASADGVRTITTDPWGYLAAYPSETNPPAASPSHAIVHLRTHGRLVGVCAMLEGHGSLEPHFSGMAFLEGDERIVVDGTRVLPGTGTEDYFDSAFYFGAGPAQTPFAQHWGIANDASVEPQHGRASACRWHVPNGAIDFTTSLDMDLEIGLSDATALDRYRTVAFVYRTAH